MTSAQIIVLSLTLSYWFVSTGLRAPPSAHFERLPPSFLRA